MNRTPYLKGITVSLILYLVTLGMPAIVTAQKVSPIYVNVDKPKSAIQPTMWGIFFEDINLAADGGLYAEMVKNRSFEYFKPTMGWRLTVNKDSGQFLILNRGSQNEANPRFARITVDESTGKFCLSNSGFRGMGIKKDNSYNFSILAAVIKGSNIFLRIELTGSKGEKIAQSRIGLDDARWKKYSCALTATAADPAAKLDIWIEGTGTVDVDMISLFPNDTWQNRPGGLRADLVQKLADLKPGFIRFPGGCIVEGYELETRYQWKNTIGPVENRHLIVNRWNTEFKHRPTPDYFQSFGLGFYEYFQLAEDIGAEPLPILNCGMACQFNSAELVPVDQLEPYIQDALDLIEFANGTPDSKWGRVRAEMGHPKPFNMKFLGIGNEQWGPQYIERYVIFEKTIKSRYPEITLVSSTGPQPDGELFDFASGKLKELNAQIVDEHYYRNPSWFFNNASRYDTYDRNGYKIFAGEYAAQSVATVSPENKNNWECALSEAAFMTGLERNADVVFMSSYAPLFAHTKGWQWTPDLIWFDNLTSFGTPDYYVQQLFSNNRGTNVLTMLKDNNPLAGKDGLYATAAWDKNTHEIILKIVNASDKSQPAGIVLQTAQKLNQQAELTVLASNMLQTVNSIDHPESIKPSGRSISIDGKKVQMVLEPWSLSIVRIKQR